MWFQKSKIRPQQDVASNLVFPNETFKICISIFVKNSVRWSERSVAQQNLYKHQTENNSFFTFETCTIPLWNCSTQCYFHPCFYSLLKQSVGGHIHLSFSILRLVAPMYHGLRSALHIPFGRSHGFVYMYTEAKKNSRKITNS